MVNLKNIPIILFCIITFGQALARQSKTKPIVQIAVESQTGVSDETLKRIIASLRRQESLLKDGLVLHYTITRKPSEAVMQKNKDQIRNSFELHDVEAIFSGKKKWEQEKRFGVDGKLTLMSSYSWNGTNGKRLIVSGKTGVIKGWNNYNPSSRRSNPTCTQNILLILGLLGTQEQSLADFITNHVKEIEMSQNGPEVTLKFSAMKGKLDYSVVLDAEHAFWPKQITQIFKNANEDGVDYGDLKYEYRDIEFGKTDVKGTNVFYPNKMRYVSYAGPKVFGKEKSGASGEFFPLVVDEISIQSIRFEQEIKDDQFQLTFPEGTVIR
jgi:hypothetical protein